MGKNQSLKISVIVPVYKAEAYLHRCVDSLLAQTFQDFEILLIDDGSPDRSGEICDEYARRDKRVRVFHKENAGVSSARNLGLDNARGEWICFVDSDDWVEMTYLYDLKSGVLSEKSLVVQGFEFVTISGAIINYKQFKHEIIIFEDFIRLFTEYNLCSYGFPWSKLFSRKLITDNHIRFETSISFSEDLLFVLDYICKADTVCFTEKKSYLYVNNAGSLTKCMSNYDIEKQGLNLFLNRLYTISLQHDVSLAYILSSSNKALAVFLSRIILSIYRNGPYIQSSKFLLKQVYRHYNNCFSVLSVSDSMFLYIVIQCFRMHLYVFADLFVNLYVRSLNFRSLFR